jgi:CubicO group peptidase (beta-lactamase class C family)
VAVNANSFSGVVRIERHSAVEANLAHGVDGEGAAVGTDTIFLTASISKSFVAASVLQLRQQHLIALDDELSSFLDEAPPAWRNVRLRHLLAHTSGLPHFSDVDGFDLYRPWPREELIAELGKTPLQFEPGSGWHYSTPGYLMLAHVVEQVAKTSYAAFLTENILSRLELASTTAGSPPPGRAVARGTIDRERAPNLDPSLLYSHVWSNAADLARWPRALAASPFFESDDGVTGFDPLVALDDDDGLTDLGYACGWFTGRLNGHRIVFHPGDQPGISTLLVYVRDEEIVLAALAAEPVDLSAMMFPTIVDRIEDSRGD